MVDDLDRAQAIAQLEEDAAIAAARKLSSIPIGFPGICKDCGLESQRLVAGRCAPCRDDIARSR